jgi:hypothetical protein
MGVFFFCLYLYKLQSTSCLLVRRRYGYDDNHNKIMVTQESRTITVIRPKKAVLGTVSPTT